MITIEQLDQIAGKKVDRPNARSFLMALEKYGPKFGMLLPHRVAQIVPQVMHESDRFQFDREIWGPTPAQKRYDTRTDLGNTPEIDGDGKKYAGHGPMQITGKYNIREFYEWCVEQGFDPPDFVRDPSLINTDPWEGLSVIYYWVTRNLNKYADEGNPEMITRKINGGLNGYKERLEFLTRTSLVLLGYGPAEIARFQSEAGELYTGDVDGLDGPQTRAALHKALLRQSPEVKGKAAPVVVETTTVVAPKELEKPVTETKGFWERITQLGGLGAIAGFSWLGDWRVILALCVGLAVVTVLGLLLHNKIVNAIRDVKDALHD